MLNPIANPTSPVLIDGPTLDKAYAKLVRHVVEKKGKRISPLTFSVGAANAGEMLAGDGKLRLALDTALKTTNSKHLKDKNKTSPAYPIDIVAFTIFPKKYYDISDSLEDFFDLYKRAFPKLKARNRINSRGLYFERLIMYGSNETSRAAHFKGNQLEWFIDQHNSRKGVRESMYQAAIFDPLRDHSRTARLGFPCLHSLSFVPHKGSLTLNAFYPTQQIYRKAYGNYLGLINLGSFMAEHMGLTFCRLNVMVGVAKMDIAKTKGEFVNVHEASLDLPEV